LRAQSKLKIGILGVGAVGQIIATALDQRRIDAELVAVSDLNHERATEFASTLRLPPRVIPLHEMIQRADLVVEAAGQAVLEDFVPRAIAGERDILVMSVGGLLGREDWFCEAAKRGCRIYVPSGAIAGLDGVKSASMGRVKCAVLTSRKPVAALAGTKYVIDQSLDLENLKEETLIFEGTAEEAARVFPTTSNVAATLRLSVERTVPVTVRVIAVPNGATNVHQIRVEGEFGSLSVEVDNVPLKLNPQTSQLAAYSALATLSNLTRSLRVGT
jgi:aspartate dehydrogenase